MGLFYRRPLCLFCALFLITSLMAWQMPLFWMLPLLLLSGAAVLLTAVGMGFRKRSRTRLLPLLLSLLFVFGAFCHLYLSVDLPQKRNQNLSGTGRIAAEILERESTCYRVRVLQVEEQRCSVGAILYLSSSESLGVGDRILCLAELRPITDLNRYRAEDGVLYSAFVKEEPAPLISRIPEDASLWTLLQSSHGRAALSCSIREGICSALVDSLGAEAGALCGGFLMGDTDLLPTETVRDFRRSGTSHLMAISGMHVAVLMGSADWLLRRLLLAKRLRCLAVSLLGFGFLFITGFASSACRSVLMLLAVYLSYLFHEENDSLTALFASVTAILLIFPYGLTDLGLWMSFLATLGLLTVYPLLERRIPRPKGRMLRALRWLLLVLTMTLVANLFLLPVMWAVFGELSWVAPLANLPLSPMADLLLVSVIPFLLLRGIPWIGEGFAFVLQALGEAFVDLLRLFSRIPKAVVSLRYPFCSVLIPLFTVIMTVLLIVRLKKRRWLLLPPVATLLAFLLCLFSYHAIYREPRIIRRETQKGTMTLAESGTSLWVEDATEGGYDVYRETWEGLSSSFATEIQAYRLRSYGRTDGITLLLRRAMIRQLYLPTPTNEEEARAAKRIFAVAEQCGTCVTFLP